MKPAITRTLSRLAPRARHPGVRVLLYHAVGAADPSDRLSLRVPLEAFRAQMRLLKEEGYRVVPLRSLLEGGEEGQGQRVAITFDDGYRDQLQAAVVLQEFGYPATFFVIVHSLDGTRHGSHYWEHWKHMDWADLGTLVDRGFEVGAHSMSHAPLTRCSAAQLLEQVAGAKQQLEARLGRPVLSFSYPHGAYDERVQDVVARTGYRLACTSVCGGNRMPASLLAVRRLEIVGTDRVEDVRRKLQGHYDWLIPWHTWRAAHA